jgi:hypothetical protein
VTTIEFPSGSTSVTVKPGEMVTFDFQQAGCLGVPKNGNLFKPALKAKQFHIKNDTFTSEALSAGDIRYYFLPDQPCPATAPAADHIIHIGSQGSILTKADIKALEKAMKAVALGKETKAAFPALWVATKDLLESLLAVKPPLPPNVEALLQELLDKGDYAYHAFTLSKSASKKKKSKA